MAFDNLTGRTFGKLFVVRLVEPVKTPNGRLETRYLCRCECQKEVVVRRKNLVSGHTSSCGCNRAKSAHEKEYKIPKKESERPQPCIHNAKGVLCEEHECEKCGWNPACESLRQERIEKLKERMNME